MMISEQNFYDEDDNAMSLKEVLEEIMKLDELDMCRLERGIVLYRCRQ